jgi:hypothetical protein
VLAADVEIVGAGRASTFISAPATPAEYTSYWAQNGILVVDGADVVVSGVTIRGPQPGVPSMVGALIGGGGSLDLGASTVTGIRDDPFSGAQRGVGIVVGASGYLTTGSLVAHDVLVSDYQKVGIVIRAGSTATVEDSEIAGRGTQCVNAANGIQINGSATVRRVRIHDNRYSDTPSVPGCSGGLASAYGLSLSNPDGPVTVEDSVFDGNELGIYLWSNPGSAQDARIVGNTVTGMLGTPFGDPAADLSYGIASAWQRGGAVISGNTVTRSDVGIALDGGAEDVASNSVRDNATGVSLGAEPARLAANSIIGNTLGLDASAPATGGPNWWGCDEGPGAPGCDAAGAAYAETAWLVLSLEVDACQVAAGGELPAVASLTTTSDGGDYTAATVPPTSVSLTTNGLVTATPASGTTVDGLLPLTLRGVSPGDGRADAHADNGIATVPGTSCAQLRVLAAPAPTLPATGAGIDPLPGAVGGIGAGLALLLGAALTTRHRRRVRQDYARGDG